MHVLAHSLVLPHEGDPAKLMMFLHGILGSRSNWRGIARRFVEARPDWGAILVDLRAHGESLGLEPPHTIETAANDLRVLARETPTPIEGVVGHSFGGKVALRWFAEEEDAKELWLIDSLPGRRELLEAPGGVLEVIKTLEDLPHSFDDRDAFVSSLERAGHERGVANWLAMNLAREADGSRTFSLDLGAIRQLLTDYARTDLWHVIEQPRKGARVEVVLGGRSSIYGKEDLERLNSAGERLEQVTVHAVGGAGHWVHVDEPDALVALMSRES